MKELNKLVAGLELAQIGWVVPDIHASVKFLEAALGIKGFPEPMLVRAQDLNMAYYGCVVESEWLTTQAYNGGSFIELVQPLSGQNMFQDYLDKNEQGGIQHLAFRLPASDFENMVGDLKKHGYVMISEVDHPIAKMAFFDTYQTLGVATEIMGVTPQGIEAIKQMKTA